MGVSLNVATRPCRRCGRAIAVVPHVETEKLVALDAAAPVYLLATWNGRRVAWDLREFLAVCGTIVVKHLDGRLVELEGIEGAYVSHASACGGSKEVR